MPDTFCVTSGPRLAITLKMAGHRECEFGTHFPQHALTRMSCAAGSQRVTVTRTTHKSRVRKERPYDLRTCCTLVSYRIRLLINQNSVVISSCRELARLKNHRSKIRAKLAIYQQIDNIAETKCPPPHSSAFASTRNGTRTFLSYALAFIFILMSGFRGFTVCLNLSRDPPAKLELIAEIMLFAYFHQKNQRYTNIIDMNE